MSYQYQNLLRDKGIQSHRSCPHTPQQTRIAERKHHQILETIRTFLIDGCVPSQFWTKAVSTAVHLINRQPSSKLNNNAPFFRLFGTQPTYDHLHNF